MRLAPPGVGMGGEVRLLTTLVRDVRVALCGGQVGMPEHLLDAPKIRASFEEMGRERVTEQVRVDATGLEPSLLSEPTENEECARAGQRSTAGIEKEVGPMAAIEMRPAEREVSAHRFDRRAAEWHDSLLAPFPENAHELSIEIDGGARKADCLGHPQTGAVEKLDERAVAHCARGGPVRSVDQAFGLGG